MDDESSFQAYVLARTPVLSRIAFLLTGDVHTAEDLVQETLLRVVAKWRRIAAAGDPDPYVRKVLYHLHVSWWRQHRQRIVPHADVPDRASPDPSAELARNLALRAALAKLPPRQRAVVVLRYFEDLTEAQTAEVLGCRVGTVKSHTRDALARLRAHAPEFTHAVEVRR